ncbi:MAG: hypothetical protein J6M21_03975 [Campylobacter sp.]|nr:hypothetical protein [Campylobacter sp.]
MIIEFEFIYNNDNALIAHFLDFYAQKSGLKYALNLEKNFTRLFVIGEEKELLKFSDEYMNLIPNSVFLAKTSVKVVETAKEHNFVGGEFKSSNFTPSAIKAYQENSALNANEFGVLSSVSVLQNGEFKQVCKENFNELLDFCFTELFHNQNLQIKLDDQICELNANADFNADFLMPTSLKALSKIFVADEKIVVALASYEKPLLNLKTNSIFRGNHEKVPAFFDVKFAGDFFIYALFSKLFEEEIFFVSVKADKSKFIKIAVLDEQFLVINNPNFIDKKSKNFLNSKDDKNLANFALFCDEMGVFDKKILQVFLSKNHNDTIKVFDKDLQVSMLNIKIWESYEELKDEICSDEIGCRLFENFSKSYDFPKGKINANASFYGLFDIVSKILFDKDAQYLLDCSKDFLGKKGVRIDFSVDKNSNFNCVKFIKSAMSFKLAGSDDKLLSFGFIDSLAYFLSDYFDLLKEEFESEAILLTGSLFEEKNLANFILNLTQNSHNAKFSNQYGLEVF